MFVIARSASDEAIHLASCSISRWIASLALAMTGRKRDHGRHCEERKRRSNPSGILFGLAMDCFACARNDGEEAGPWSSLRGAQATKQSIWHLVRSRHGLLRFARNDGEEAGPWSSLRGAQATKQSIWHLVRSRHGLLRFARNDGEEAGPWSSLRGAQATKQSIWHLVRSRHGLLRFARNDGRKRGRASSQ